MTKQRIFLIGGGGHCRSCIHVLDRLNTYEIVGIIDFIDRVGEHMMSYEVIGDEDDLARFRMKGDLALLTVGQIKDTFVRRKLARKLDSLGIHTKPIIADTAIASPDVVIRNGSIVMHRAIINSGAEIGEHCIINTASIVEHDAIIGDFCHVSTMSIINGGVKLGNDVFVGSNSTLIHGIQITNNVVIAAGSTVIHDIQQSGIYAGSPAKLIHQHQKAS
ncbi:MAG: acetyltransferase [Vicingaceae bacterium]